MRERLTVAFILLTILLLLGAGVVRTFVLRDLIREQEAEHLRQEAELVAAVVHDQAGTASGVDSDRLSQLVGSSARLEYDATGAAPPLVVRGPDYSGTDDPDRDLSASAVADGATVTVSESPEAVGDLIGRDVGALAALFVLIAVVAGVAGFVIASGLSSPFKRLAAAAEALGRGRFDLELPRTRIPEAQAISTALRTSALQLEDRVHRERAFAEHASHVLRTPLTSLRLELEDLSLRDDVPEEAKEAAARCLTSVDQVGSVANELVELTRGDSLVAGAELPLVDIATQLAQRWADRLGVRNRELSAAAEGDLDLTYTPGPVEHVTDLLLADVIRRGTGPVRLVLQGETAGHLRVHVESGGRAAADHGDEPVDRVTQVRSVVESMGGRVTGRHPAEGIVVLLPRR
jgi:signal transduction histidine kinase